MKRLEPSPAIRLDKLKEIPFDTLRSAETTGLLNIINEEYYYWDKVKYLKCPKGINNKQLWAIVKLRRRNTPFGIKFGNYLFHWNTNSKMQSYLHFLDLNVGGNIESSSIVSKEDKTRYLLSSIMEEAIASSQIEGAATTRRHAKEMLRKNIKPRNRSEQMIHNNFVTIQEILQIKSEPLTLERLLHIHTLITLNAMDNPKEIGVLRGDDEVKIIDTEDGSTIHQPPPHTELRGLLKDLFIFFNEENDKTFVHPIIKACIIHFAIGFIHPFSDGNGRTARALFYWYLLRKGYWLTEYLSISRLILKSKSQYAYAYQYTEIDENDLTYFILYKLRTMRLSFEELREYIKYKNGQKKQLNMFLGVDGITIRQAQIMDWFREDPELLLTVQEVTARLGVSYMTARGDLSNLTTKGYLTIRPINKVLKGYIKGEKFDLFLNKIKGKAKEDKTQAITITQPGDGHYTIHINDTIQLKDGKHKTQEKS